MNLRTTTLSVLTILLLLGAPTSAGAQSSASRALSSIPWSGVYVQIEEREQRFIGAYGGRAEHLRYRVELSAPVNSETHQATLFRAGRFASALVASAFVGHDSTPTLRETYNWMRDQPGACARVCDRAGESETCGYETFATYANDPGSVRRRIEDRRVIVEVAARRLEQAVEAHRACLALAEANVLRAQTEAEALATALRDARTAALLLPPDAGAPLPGPDGGTLRVAEAEARATAAEGRLTTARAALEPAKQTCGDALLRSVEPLLRFVSPGGATAKERVCNLAHPGSRAPDSERIVSACAAEPVSAANALIVRDAVRRLFEGTEADLSECRAIAHSAWVRDHHDVVSRAVGEPNGLRWMLGGQATAEYSRLSAYSAMDLGGESTDFDQLRVDLGPSLFVFEASSDFAWYFTARTGLRVAQQPEVDEAERCTMLPSTMPTVTGRVCEDVNVYAEAPGVAASFYGALAFGVLFPGGLDGSRPGLELRTSFDDVAQRALFRWGLNAFISPRVVDGGSSDFMNPLIVRFGIGFEASQALYERDPIAGTQSPTVRLGDLVDFSVLGLAGVSI